MTRSSSMTSFALFGATLAGLVRRLRLGLLLHATRSDRGTPRHTVSKELCPPEPRQAKALPAANGDPPISNWYHTLEPDNLRAQIRHHLLQRGVLRQQAFGQGLKVATRRTLTGDLLRKRHAWNKSGPL